MSRMTLEDEADLYALAAGPGDEADPTHCAPCAARALLAVAPEPDSGADRRAADPAHPHPTG